MMQGAATRRTGEAKTRRIPNPAKIPITCNIKLHNLFDISREIIIIKIMKT